MKKSTWMLIMTNALVGSSIVHTSRARPKSDHKNVSSIGFSIPISDATMHWNWQLPQWPHFSYDPSRLSSCETQFIQNAKQHSALVNTMTDYELRQIILKILRTNETAEADKDEHSTQSTWLHSSIHSTALSKRSRCTTYDAQAMAELQSSMHQSYDSELSHEMLWRWHSVLCGQEITRYRIRPETMWIVSYRNNERYIHFEAPPSSIVQAEMAKFIEWFNNSRTSVPLLERAALAHVYFESIHPFEDGNGRIGRLLVEKILCQGSGQPVFLMLIGMISGKKEYQKALKKCNHTLHVQPWIDFFARHIMKAQHTAYSCLPD